jgi:hypothetical protein
MPRETLPNWLHAPMIKGMKDKGKLERGLYMEGTTEHFCENKLSLLLQKKNRSYRIIVLLEAGTSRDVTANHHRWRRGAVPGPTGK